ncbi:MAG: hypothetical protein WBO17_16325 [Sphingorhabdus sp.]
MSDIPPAPHHSQEQGTARQMIDNLSILLSHALLALALWNLMNRPELDIEDPPTPETEPEGYFTRRHSSVRKIQVPPDA